jgi:hypothetical protein
VAVEEKKERRELDSHANTKLGIKALTLMGLDRSLCVDTKKTMSPSGYWHLQQVMYIIYVLVAKWRQPLGRASPY